MLRAIQVPVAALRCVAMDWQVALARSQRDAALRSERRSVHPDGWIGQQLADEGRELRGSSEAMIRSLDPQGCPACGSVNVDRQTPDEGRPFSCNNCGLEFFKDTGEAQA